VSREQLERSPAPRSGRRPRTARAYSPSSGTDHIYAEHPLIGDRRICTTGYFSMVALDQAGQPVPVPRLLLEDDESRAEWAVGEEVRRSIDARRT
jgi:hypothetical protein